MGFKTFDCARQVCFVMNLWVAKTWPGASSGGSKYYFEPSTPIESRSAIGCNK